MIVYIYLQTGEFDLAIESVLFFEYSRFYI